MHEGSPVSAKRKPRKFLKQYESGPMAPAQKLAEAKRLVALYEEQVAQEDRINRMQVGDKVTFSFGRGNTRTDRTGTILQIGDTPRSGKRVVVLAGSDFDWAVCTVPAIYISRNLSVVA